MRLHLKRPAALLVLLAVPQLALANGQTHQFEIQHPGPGARVDVVEVARQESPEASDAASTGRVTLSFRGTLQDAVREIARQSGVNVIATSRLDTPVELHLTDVPARSALNTLARVYDLELETADEDGAQQFILRARNEVARPSGPLLPPTPPVPPRPALPGPDFDAWLDERVEERTARALRQVEDATGEARDGASVEEAPERKTRRFSVNVVRPKDLMVFAQHRTVGPDESVADVLVTSGSLTLDGTAHGDVVVVGGNVELNGEARGDAVVIGGNLYVDGSVLGDVQVIGGRVTLGENADVHGGVEAVGGEIHREDGSRVRGAMVGSARRQDKVADEEHEVELESHDERPGFLTWIGKLVTRFMVLFGLGFLFLMLVPDRVRKLGQEMRHNPVADVTTGFVGMLALGPLLLLLCITLVGIPVALLLVLLLPLGLVMGTTAIAHEIGMRMPVRWTLKTQAGVLALGLLPLVFVSTLPVFGFLLTFSISLLSLGALVRTRFGGRAAGEQPGNGIPTAP